MGGRTILRWDRLLDRARHRPAVRSFSAAGAGRVPLLLAIPNPPGEGALEDGRRFFHSPAFDQRPRVASDRRSAAGLHEQATVERVALLRRRGERRQQRDHGVTQAAARHPNMKEGLDGELR
jgi:hypothetical protein